MAIDFSDQDLLGRVRDGDTAAFGELYAHHSAAAHRAARRIARDPHVAEDLVSESFVRVFSALQSENGPRGDLFPYLLVTMRNVAATWGRDSVRWTPVGDDTAFQPRDARDLIAGADEAPVDGMAVSFTSEAFRTLPKRWRTVLWYLDVEGESAADVGRRMELNEVAVRQLARRAREGLREAYLTAYLGGTSPDGEHIPPNDLVQMARGTISIRRRGQVERHLDTCPNCTRMLFEAAEENSTLRALAIPFWIAIALAFVNGASHVAGWFKPLAFFRPRGKLSGGAVAAASVVGLVAAGLIVGNLIGPHHPGRDSAGGQQNNGGSGPGGSAGSSGSPGATSGASPSNSSGPSSVPTNPSVSPSNPSTTPGVTTSPTVNPSTGPTGPGGATPTDSGGAPGGQQSGNPTPTNTATNPPPVPNPSVSIAQSVDLALLTDDGGITVRASMTNSGNVPLTNVTASAVLGGAAPRLRADNLLEAPLVESAAPLAARPAARRAARPAARAAAPQAAAAATSSCTVASTLAVGASASCTITLTADVAQRALGSVTLSTSVTATAPDGSQVTSTSSATTVQLKVAALGATALPIVPGNNLTVVISNTGTETLSGVTGSVNLVIGGKTVLSVPCAAAGNLLPKTDLRCLVPVTQAQLDLGLPITVTVSMGATSPSGTHVVIDPANSPPITVPFVVAPAITAAQTSVSPAQVTAVGPVVLTYTVTDTGNTTITTPGADVVLTVGGRALPPQACAGETPSLLPGASFTCTATYVVTQADLDNDAPISASVTAGGTAPNGAAITSSVGESTPLPVVVSAALGATPVFDQTASAQVGDNNFDVTITNAGNQTITGPTGTTTVFVDGVAQVIPACTGPATLAPGAVFHCPVVYQLTQAQIDAGARVTVVAKAAGTAPDGTAVITDPGSSSTPVVVPVRQTPALLVSLAMSPAALTSSGQTITATVTATNTGNVSLSAPSAVLHIAGQPRTCTMTPAVVAPGASFTCSATYASTAADLPIANGIVITAGVTARHDSTFVSDDDMQMSGVLRNVSTTTCLDVEGGATAMGTHIIVYPCHGQGNQSWTYDLADKRLQSIANCASVPARPAAGDFVLLATCSATATKWTLAADGTIRPDADPALCVVPGRARSGFYDAQLQVCATVPTAAQTWSAPH